MWQAIWMLCVTAAFIAFNVWIRAVGRRLDASERLQRVRFVGLARLLQGVSEGEDPERVRELVSGFIDDMFPGELTGDERYRITARGASDVTTVDKSDK